ncbi:MAG: universal stress protein [Halioglobus sp.]
MSLSKIMVVIDPTEDDQPAYERALVSACMTGARLHLYTCLPASADETMMARYQARSETLAQRAEADGVETTTEIECAEDWSQRVSLAAARHSVSMIFKNSFEHSDVQREQRSTSDWTLLRLAPCPVLMVKNHRDWKHRRVLAAINSQSTDVAHIKLNNQIIGFAQRFTDAYGSDAHFINAYQDRNHQPDASALSQACGAPVEQIHVIEGAPAAAVSNTANELGVDLVIIGTVGRTGLKGQVVGNTAERILDHTVADVLVLN